MTHTMKYILCHARVPTAYIYIKREVSQNNTYSYYMQCTWLFFYYITFLFHLIMLVAVHIYL